MWGHHAAIKSNIDDYSEFIVSRELLRYVLPILLTVGTVGSILTILVLRRKPLKQVTTMFYLTVLAFADLGVLYIVLMRLWLEKVYEVYFRIWNQFNCKFHVYLSYFALTFNVWILVAVIVDRCVLVSFPIAARRWCTLRNAWRVVIVVALVNILIHLHLLWTVDRIYTGKNTIAGNNYSCYHKNSSDFKFFYEKVEPWITFSELCLVPFVVMVTCNCLIIRQLVVSARNLRLQRQLMKPDTDSKHFRTCSLKSIFSERKPLARQIRNRKVEADDICNKHEANLKARSKEDRCENRPTSMFSSNHVTEQQTAHQVPESGLCRSSELSFLRSSTLVFEKEKKNEFQNKDKCGELSSQNTDDTSTTSILPLSLPVQPRAQELRSSPPDVTRRKCCGIPNVTLFVLTVSSLSCIPNVPATTYFIYSRSLDSKMSDHEFAKLELWWAFSHVIFYTNIAMHFLLFCLTIRRFRQEMLAMFCCAQSDRLLG